MSVLGRLKDGKLKIAGEINERFPLIRNGLVAHFPFDGTVEGYGNNLDLTTTLVGQWNTASGASLTSDTFTFTQGSFTSLGTWQFYTSYYGLVSGNTYEWSADVVSSSISNLIICRNNTTEWETGSVVKNEQFVSGKVSIRWTQTGTASNIHLGACGKSDSTSLVQSSGYLKVANVTLRQIIIPITSANTTLSFDGVFIEEATTNAFYSATSSDSLLFNFFYSTVSTTSLVDICSPVINQKVIRQISAKDDAYISAPDSLGINYATSSTAKLAVASGDSVTLSIYAKGQLGGEIIQIWIFKYASDTGTYATADVRSFTLTNEWKRYTYTVPVTSGQPRAWGRVDNDVAGQTVYWSAPQLEKKAYASSFAMGSSGTSTLSLPKSVMDYTSFSLVMKIKLDQNNMSQNLYFDAYPKLYIFRNAGTHTVSFSSSTQQNITLPVSPGVEEFTIAITRDYISSTNVVTNVYYNGILVGWATSTTAPSMLMNYNIGDYIKLHGWGSSYPANSNIKSLSVYNRALSVSEISKLYKAPFSIPSSGNINPVTFKEKPIIPSDVYYFPLSFNSSDQNGLINPSSEVNTVYNENGVWIGSATTNMYMGFLPQVLNGGSFTNMTETAECPGINGTSWKLKKTGTGNQWNGWEASYNVGLTTNGQNLTVSQYYTTTSGIETATSMQLYAQDWSRVVGTFIGGGGILKSDGKWNFLSSTAKLTEDYTNPILTDAFAWGYSTSPGIMYVSAQMWEKKAFPSPWCPNGSTRGNGYLAYNFNRDINLDWNGNWTICYWKIPIGTQDNSLTAYNIESLGCNSNSVGGGYCWMGKESSYNRVTVGLAGNSSLPVFTNYFNKPHMVSITKSGTFITFKFWGIDGIIGTIGKAVGATLPSNYYVTQYGYDFKMGGWDNASPCNTYYKDLIVAKRAMSDSELQSLYNIGMRSYTNGILLVRNGISELNIL